MLASPEFRSRLAVGITSAPRTEPVLQQCIDSVIANEVHPTLFVEPYTPPPERLEYQDASGHIRHLLTVANETCLGVWYNWLSMCEYLLKNNPAADYIATLQDDCDLSPHAFAMVERFFEKPGQPNCFTVSLYTPSHYFPTSRGWEFKSDNNLWGAVGFVFRRDTLQRLLYSETFANWRGAYGKCEPGSPETRNSDTAIGIGLSEIGESIAYYLPSLSTHCAKFSTIRTDSGQTNEGKRQALSRLEYYPTPYWERRCGYAYYRQVAHLIKPDGETLLDVGGGVLEGVQFLTSFPQYVRTSVELAPLHNLTPDFNALPDVHVIQQDFMTWETDQTFDVVLCMQMLEHIADPAACLKKLFSLARYQVIITIPFLWKQDVDEEHIHNNISLETLTEWAGRQPSYKVIVTEFPSRVKRLVVVYVRPF